VYSKIGSSIGFDEQQSSLTQWFVAGSFLTLVLASGLALAWSNRLP
jgi:hypothetical protein